LNMPLEHLIKTGFKARVCLHEKMHVHPGKHTVYPEYVQRFCKMDKLGITYFGNFYDVSNPIECINFAGSDSWDTYGIWEKHKIGYDTMYAAYQEKGKMSQFEDPEVRQFIQDMQDYSEIGPNFRSRWDTELMQGLFGPLC
jgi:hypothetical protein